MSETSPPVERPGRYHRSFGGLIGAMLVLVVAVTVAWLGLGAFREEAEFEPLPIDYEASVQALVDSGAPVAYPEELPAGWRVNNLDPGPPFTLAMLTDQERFAGVYHGTQELDAVLDRYVDETTDEAEPVELVDGDGVFSTWQVFTDDGGDTAYVRVRDADASAGTGEAEDAEEVVTMVYGSAPEDELVALVEDLRTSGIGTSG